MEHQTCPVTFDGQCLEAFESYAEILGGSIEAVSLRDQSSWSVHQALLRVGSWTLTGRDLIERDAIDSGAVALMLCSVGAEDAWQLHRTLAIGGQTTTPMQQTGWAKLAGGLIDRFGTAWIVCHGVRHSSPRLLAHSPELSFDVLPLDRGLHDASSRTRTFLRQHETRSARVRGMLKACA